jgi:hypothetical protein
MSDKAEGSAAGPNGPNWIREAWTLFWEEVRSFVRTGVGFLRRPGRFSADWVAGRQRALNPLGFVATSLAVSGLIRAVFPHRGGGDSLATEIALATLPYVYYALLGVLAHPFLRLGGSRRGISATLAISLFAGGGPGLLTALSIYLVAACRWLLYGPPTSALLDGLPIAARLAAIAILFTPVIVLVTTLVLGLAGAHGVRRWRAAVAMAFSLIASGIGLGVLHAHGGFGVGVPHFVLSFYDGIPSPDVFF